MTTSDLLGKLLQFGLGLVVFGALVALLLVLLDREARTSRSIVVRLVAAGLSVALALLGQLGMLDGVLWFTPLLQSAATIIGWPLAVGFLATAGLSLAAPRIARSARLLTWVVVAVAIVGLSILAETGEGPTLGAWPWAAAFAVSVAGLLGFLASRNDESGPMLPFLIPAALLLTVGLVYPALRTGMLAFTNSTGEFNGLDNFVWMFTQPTALITLGNTLLWVIFVPTLSTAIGLLYAVLIDKSRGEKYFKMLVFLPMAISFVGAGIIWKFMYAYRSAQYEQFGLINQIIVWFGGEPQQILQTNWWVAIQKVFEGDGAGAVAAMAANPVWNTFALIIVMVWIQTGFAMVVLSASIKGVPVEQLEAAELDGATAWQRFWSVTVPGIRGSLVVVVTTISIATLKVFDIVRTMTAGNFNSSVIANEMYTQSFLSQQPGRGAALALILFIMVLPIVVYNIRVMARQREIR